MSQKDIMHILERVSSGELSPSEAALELKMEPFQDLGFAKIDHHRELRQGIAEVIYGEGKTPEQILKIVEAMLERGQKTVLITRMSAKAAGLVSAQAQRRGVGLVRVNDKIDVLKHRIGERVHRPFAGRPARAGPFAVRQIAQRDILRRDAAVVHAAGRDEIMSAVRAGRNIAPRPGNKPVFQQLAARFTDTRP